MKTRTIARVQIKTKRGTWTQMGIGVKKRNRAAYALLAALASLAILCAGCGAQLLAPPSEATMPKTMLGASAMEAAAGASAMEAAAGVATAAVTAPMNTVAAANAEDDTDAPDDSNANNAIGGGLYPTDYQGEVATDMPNVAIIHVDLNMPENKAYRDTVENLFNHIGFDLSDSSAQDRIIGHDGDDELYQAYFGSDLSGRYLLVNNYKSINMGAVRKRHLDFYDSATGKLLGTVTPNRYTLYYPHDNNTIIIGLFTYPDSMSLETLMPGKTTDYYYYLLEY